MTVGRDRRPPFFGQDPNAYDLDDGRPGAGLFANAVQVWALEQRRTVTVRDAAEVFNCPDAMICEAIEDHPWMFVEGPDDDPTKQTIEHEGE
ncbi:MAG: hypothetical protein WD341_06260 [Tistlia sp.]|uniref:hypothetical protein n=1 Tax=Tistlia sp. TaxID=3057121 RepID=UPI0034A181BD